MAVSEINLAANAKAERKLLVTAVDVSDTSSTPEYEIQGAGIEESSIKYSVDKETITDILGVTETSVNKVEAAQTFDPNTIRGGKKLIAKLLDIYKRKAWSELSLFNVLVIRGYLGTDGAWEAELHKNCTISLTSEGGSGYVGCPFDIDLSGDKTLGTVDKLTGTITFTPDEE